MKADLAVLCQLHPLALFQVLWLVIIRLQVWLGWEVNINSSEMMVGIRNQPFGVTLMQMLETLVRPRRWGFFLGESCPIKEAGINAITIK